MQNKDDYYFRGAFLDAVRGIDFVCTRPEVDTTRIVAQGGSQGGTLTFAAAALEKRIKVCATAVPFVRKVNLLSLSQILNQKKFLPQQQGNS